MSLLVRAIALYEQLQIRYRKILTKGEKNPGPTTHRVSLCLGVVPVPPEHGSSPAKCSTPGNTLPILGNGASSRNCLKKQQRDGMGSGKTTKIYSTSKSFRLLQQARKQRGAAAVK